MVATRRSQRLQELPQPLPIDEPNEHDIGVDYIDERVMDESRELAREHADASIIADEDDDVEYAQPDDVADYPSDHDNDTINKSIHGSMTYRDADNSTYDNDNQQSNQPQYQSKRLKVQHVGSPVNKPVDTPTHKPSSPSSTVIQGSDTVRHKLTDMLVNTLTQHSTDTDESIVQRQAELIELAIYNKHNQQADNEYKHQFRELIGELSSTLCSQAIINRIIHNQITADQLINMSFKDLASSTLRRERSDAEAEAERDIILDDKQYENESYTVLGML